MSHKKTILAVEDSESDLKLLSYALKQVGFKDNLLIARTADEAYRLMVQRLDETLPLPDLVLLDLGLPDETGMEMLRKLKSEKALSTMKVVVFSGSKSTKNMSKAKELGAVWYFVKPDSPADMKYIAQELVSISDR
jgi:DNA-binding response OmpR family regulator